jgi:hypothetical protein
MATIAVLAMLLPGAEGLQLKPVKHGAMEARLMVRVERSRTPGYAELTLTLVIEGPPLMEVETPRLDELNDNWEADPITWASLQQDKLTWTQVIRLQQMKAGRVVTPVLMVRFREGPKAPWSPDAKWDRILRDMSETLEPESTRVPPPPERLPWWLYAFPGVSVIVLVPIALVLRRYREAPPSPPTPDLRALTELDRVEQRHRDQATDSGWFHTRVSTVLRRYLAERFDLKAMQQTTVEFVAALESVPQLSGEQQALLREVLERCDQGRFARIVTPLAECQALAAQVRTFVRETAMEAGDRTVSTHR